MWTIRDIVCTGAAIIAGLAGLGLMRFIFIDYFPPEVLIRDLQRSNIITAGMRRPAMVGYGTVALVMMAVFFKFVQQRWPGRGGVKGLVFGASLGVVWSFGFLAGWAFLGTTLSTAFLNSVADLIPLAFAGWLIGLAVGQDVPRSAHGTWRPWLAILFVAFGFVSVHTLGARLFADHFASTANLLLVPTTLLQIALLSGLGIWAGVMYVMIRIGLPFNKTWARVAFFAFGVFGHCWTWFHVFFVIEFAGVLPTVLFVGLLGAAGVFAGALAYESLASGRRQVD